MIGNGLFALEKNYWKFYAAMNKNDSINVWDNSQLLFASNVNAPVCLRLFLPYAYEKLW